MSSNNGVRKAVYWILTIPQHQFTPYLAPGVQYIRGQLESGGESGYLHWQLFVVLEKQSRLAAVKRIFGDTIHAESTRSKSSEEYVWKEETRVVGTQFELGQRKLQRNDSKDWDKILASAKAGRFEEIPSDVVIRSYQSLKRICTDNLRPNVRSVSATVFWGPTSTGKSHTAWSQAGMDAYCKDPNTKFWDGYSGEINVVVDEFRGLISIANLLRWLDKYPVRVEVKGGSAVLNAERFWITSNLHPRDWYPGLDETTQEALLRRLNVVEMRLRYVSRVDE